MRPLGLVLPAAAIGLGALLIKPQRRGFYKAQNQRDQALGAEQSGLVPDVTIEERHLDEMMITDHPVEMGAVISDHAFQLPATVVIRCAWSNSPTRTGGLLGQAVSVAGAALPGTGGLVARVIGAARPTAQAAQSLFSGNAQDQVKAVYQELLALYAARELFDVYTGKRVYHNMIFKSLAVDTDERNENILSVTATCREILITRTSVVTAGSASLMKDPERTAPVIDRGRQQLAPAPNFVETP